MKYITLTATLLWFLLATYLSHQTGSQTYHTSLHLAELLKHEDWNGLLRKAAHVVTFAVLSFLLYATVEAWEMSKVWIVGVFIWAVLDEVTKVFVPGRHCSMFEIGLNMIGCLVGMVVGAVICG